MGIKERGEIGGEPPRYGKVSGTDGGPKKNEFRNPPKVYEVQNTSNPTEDNVSEEGLDLGEVLNRGYNFLTGIWPSRDDDNSYEYQQESLDEAVETLQGTEKDMDFLLDSNWEAKHDGPGSD